MAMTRTSLARAVKDFAADHAAILIGALAVRELGSFVALVPETPQPFAQSRWLKPACATSTVFARR